MAQQRGGADERVEGADLAQKGYRSFGLLGLLFDDSVELLEHSQETAANLPYGDKRRLEIAIGLASEPDLMFMDEPTAGMSPEETQHTVDLLEELKEDRGLTIVLVEHDMEVIFRVADRISVLHRGEIIASGPPDEVKGDADVQEAYLGGVEL